MCRPQTVQQALIRLRLYLERAYLHALSNALDLPRSVLVRKAQIIRVLKPFSIRRPPHARAASGHVLPTPARTAKRERV